MRFFVRINIVLFCLLFFSNCNDSSEKAEDYDEAKNLLSINIENARAKSKSIEDREYYLKTAYDEVRKFDQNKFKLRKLTEIADVYLDLNNHVKYSEYSDEAFSIAKSLSDSLEIAKLFCIRGAYFRDKKLDSAYKNFLAADKIYRSLDESKRIDPLKYAFDHGAALIDLAKLSRKVKDYSKSEELTTQAIKKFELSGNLGYVPLSYSNLGIVAKRMERYEDAVDYFEKAIEYAKGTSKDTLYAVLSYNNIGTVYKSNREYSKAKEYYLKSLSFKNFMNKRPKRFASLLDNLAYVNFLSGKDGDSVLKLFHKTYKIRDSVNDLSGLSTNNLHFAEYYKSKGNDSLAKLYALRVEETAPMVNNNVELLDSYQLLSELSDSKEGLVYAQKYIKLNDSLIKEQQSNVNKFARIKFDTDKKIEEIQEISRENQILIFTILGLSVLFLLGYIIFRQQQSNKELLFEQKQQQSNQEIYRLLLSQQVKLEEGRKLEQQRMSEELHDGVLGRLFGVRLSLDGINQRVNDGFTEARDKYIVELKSIEKEIRLISHDLGTETISTEIPYVDVVESLVSDLCATHKLDFEFKNDENIDWELVDNQKKVNLFRIIQESLQNIFKHAQAKLIKISFDYVDDKINLTILDDGIGFKSSRVKRGIGLKNITSRVKQMNGVVDFMSSNENIQGTKVSIGVPM